MSEPVRQLIVRQRPVAHPGLEELVAALRDGFGFDPYTGRQRLLGPGLVQLDQGDALRLDAMAALLRRHGYPCWIVAVARPAFTPPRLRSLAVSADSVEFHCEGERHIRLERGQRVVGVLADVSGELAGRQVKRMLAQNAYLGRGQATVFTPEELRQAIVKGQPVFDCYLLDEQGRVAAAFRAFSGRFNPEGLGSRAGLSAARNLEALATLVGDYAPNYRLHTDFGLSQLPGCLPQPARNDANALLGNLDALTRYGWLVTSLTEPVAGASGSDLDSLGTLLVAELASPAGGGDTEHVLPTVAAGYDTTDATGSPAVKVTAKLSPLPPPPERPERARSLRRILPTVGFPMVGVLLVVISKAAHPAAIVSLAVSLGLLPGFVAVALCFGGIRCLRMKRFVEDTPTSRIRSLAMGLVKVHGRATRRYALVAPMTQSACVWYRLRKYRRDNNNWTMTSESDSAHVPFILDDGSGQVVVDPVRATVNAMTQETGYPGESALIGAALDGGPAEKWIEELIYEGTTLEVLGYARPARGVRPGLRQRTIEKLRRLKLDPQALRRYDTNGDGRIDAEEWQTAHADLEQQAAAEQLSEQGTPATRNVLIGRPPRGLPFLIAEGVTGTGLAGRYGWFAAALFVLGSAAFVLALKLALDYFHMS